MDARDETDDEQKKRWNGVAGRAWVDAQEVLDRMFEPFETLLVEAVSAGSCRRVLDVGCGTGATTLAIARRLGANGLSTGIDISETMIAAARARAERDGMRVSTFPGRIARRSPSSAQWLGEESSHFNMAERQS